MKTQINIRTYWCDMCENSYIDGENTTWTALKLRALDSGWTFVSATAICPNCKPAYIARLKEAIKRRKAVLEKPVSVDAEGPSNAEPSDKTLEDWRESEDYEHEN